jgi:predicted nucleic acid-binding protein
METQTIVTDASAVVKWFLEEDFSDTARQMRDSFATGKLTISVPSLFFYEALNVLWHSGLYGEEDLMLAARSLSKYGFDVHEPRGSVYEQSAALSSRHDISVYDAAYVALALHLKAPLYTADSELIEKFPEATRHIGSFKPPEP